MGFSLKAALAGAIQGGAHAVGKVADFQIKEQSRLREREEARAQQMEMMRYQDELLANRERRVDELRTAREENQRKSKAEALRGGLTFLRESGIDPGSIKGQQMLATKLADAGYTEMADKYFDNAIRLGQIESAADLRKEEMKLRHATIAESRASREAQHADKEFLRGFEVAVKAGHNLKIADPDNEGKLKNFSAAGSAFGALFSELVDAKVPRSEAMRIVGNTAQELGRAIDNPVLKSKGIDPHTILSSLVEKARADAGLIEPAKPASSKGSTSDLPLTSAPKEDDFIPGTIFNSGGEGKGAPASALGSTSTIDAMRTKAQADAMARYGRPR